MELLIHSQTSNGAAVEIWEWIRNFILHFTGHVITYGWLLMVGLKLIHLNKKDPWWQAITRTGDDQNLLQIVSPVAHFTNMV